MINHVKWQHCYQWTKQEPRQVLTHRRKETQIIHSVFTLFCPCFICTLTEILEDAIYSGWLLEDKATRNLPRRTSYEAYLFYLKSDEYLIITRHFLNNILTSGYLSGYVKSPRRGMLLEFPSPVWLPGSYICIFISKSCMLEGNDKNYPKLRLFLKS